MASKATGKVIANGSKKGFALFLERVQQGPNAVWTKEELLTAVHWQKQLTALVLGIIWGVIPLLGLNAIATWGVIQLMTTVVFYRMILRVDEEIHGGVGEALIEGASTFIAVFVLFWVLTYNLVHGTVATAAI